MMSCWVVTYVCGISHGLIGLIGQFPEGSEFKSEVILLADHVFPPHPPLQYACCLSSSCFLWHTKILTPVRCTCFVIIVHVSSSYASQWLYHEIFCGTTSFTWSGMLRSCFKSSKLKFVGLFPNVRVKIDLRVSSWGLETTWGNAIPCGLGCT